MVTEAKNIHTVEKREVLNGGWVGCINLSLRPRMSTLTVEKRELLRDG